jgi:hypothetical protein
MAATQSSAPTVVLATLCLNEMEWLPSLWAQHKDWPGLAYWVFVEAADEVYATASPGMVGPRGLSVDGTSEYLTELSLANPGKAVYLPLGIVANKGPGRDQNKARARDAYMGCIREEGIAPDLVVVLDADEFYPKRDQALITALGGPDVRNPGGYCLRQRHIWHPPCVQEANHLQLSLKAAEAWPGAMGDPPRSGLFDSEVIGGYWAVPHCRVWRWRPGLRYARNHNWPETREGVPLNQNMARLDKLHLTHNTLFPKGPAYDVTNVPQVIHMGFASRLEGRAAKHAYYRARGEGQEPDPRQRRTRMMYCRCREAWEQWAPGKALPDGAKVIPYTGPTPEVFQ